MDKSVDDVCEHLRDIQGHSEAIEHLLADQFQGSDGISYKTTLIHGLLASICHNELKVLPVIAIASVVSAIAITLHVVHHW